MFIAIILDSIVIDIYHFYTIGSYDKEIKGRQNMIIIKTILFLLVIFILLSSRMVTNMTAAGVSISPNASDVHAIVKEKYTKNGIAYVTLDIIAAEDYKSMPNFMKENIGKDIVVMVSKDDLSFFDKKEVNVLVAVSGDERSQFYTAKIKPAK
jgi:uncharacterized membrane protein